MKSKQFFYFGMIASFALILSSTPRSALADQADDLNNSAEIKFKDLMSNAPARPTTPEVEKKGHAEEGKEQPTEAQNFLYRKIRVQRTSAFNVCMNNAGNGTEKVCLAEHGGRMLLQPQDKGSFFRIKNDISAEQQLQASRIKDPKRGNLYKEYYECLQSPQFVGQPENSLAAFRANTKIFENAHRTCKTKVNDASDGPQITDQELFSDAKVIKVIEPIEDDKTEDENGGE